MKRILALLALGVIMLSGCELPVKKTSSPLDTAIEMKNNLDNNENSALFMIDNVDGDLIFDSLEAIYPFAFYLELVSYQIGLTEISVNIPNNAQQIQAKELAEKIAINQTEGLESTQDKIAALHDYLILNCKYDVEAAEQEVLDGTSAPFTAYGALVDGKAVCSGYARAFMMMCEAIGIEAIYISDSQMNHSWNAVKIDDEIYYIDCTFDDPIPDQGKKIIREYFLKTSDELKKTHTWNENFYKNIMG